jgi:hypothetical protein
VHIEFAIDAIHAPGIEEDKRDKYVDRSLLREPESELKSTKADAVQLLDEQDAETIGADEPDEKADRDETQVGAPVSQSVFRMHVAPGIVPVAEKMPGIKKAASCEAAF